MPNKTAQNKANELATISLLSASTGSLEVVKIPNAQGADWILPKNLLLDKVDFGERLAVVLWQGFDIPTYALLAKDEAPEAALIIEGVNEFKRIALLVKGDIIQQKIRISELPDAQEAAHQPNQDGKDYTFAAVMYAGSPAIVPDVDKLASHLVDLD